MESFSGIHTACKNCVFAEYKGKQQVGCAFNKIEEYKRAGVKIVPVYDDDKEFFVIDNRFCMFYRNEAVMERYSQDSWKKIVESQNVVPYHLIVFFENGHTYRDLKTILTNFSQEQHNRPNMVTVINKQYGEENSISPKDILDLLNSYKFHLFSLKNVYNKELTDREFIDLAMDSAMKYPYPWYVVFRSNFEVPKDFMYEFNQAIFVDMKQVCFAKPVDDLSGMIVGKIAHKKHSGNAFRINLEDKILKEESNTERLVFNAEDLCPSLK